MSFPLNRCVLLTAFPVLLVAACASEPDPKATQFECTSKEPPIGSLVVRREACVPVTAETRANARRQIEEMQEQQRRSRPPPPGN